MADADQMTDMAGLIDASDLDALTDKMRAPAASSSIDIEKAEAERFCKFLGTQHWLERVEKWRNMTNFVETYTDTSDYWHPVDRQRPIYEDALQKAGDWFAANGGPRTMRIDDDQVEVRLYENGKQWGFPNNEILVFLVKGRLNNGDVVQCPQSYLLSPEQVAHLKLTNRWPTKRRRGEALH